MTKKVAATKKSTTSKKAAQAPAPAVEVPAAEASAPSNKVAKTQLVELVADKTGLTKKQSEEDLSAILGMIVEAMKSGQSVGLPGLGTFSVKKTATRTGVRPGTSERIQIPAGKKVAFKVASTLKAALGEG